MSDSVHWASAFATAALAFPLAIYYTATAWFTHRERIARIERGIDPDAEVKKVARSDFA